ncbi:MAG: O-antigen ligase family protein [Bacteroidales bacterium]|nr:O-antigen ligase family protein [Bacteroidales bacterium]
MKGFLIFFSLLSIVFSLFITLLLNFTEQAWYLYFIPGILGILILYFYKLDLIFLLTTVMIPFSINIENFEWDFALFVPTEPLLIGMLFFLILELFYQRSFLLQNFMKEPLFFLILLYFTWMFFTSMTSQIPLVSFKYLLAHAWLIFPPLVLGYRLFLHKPQWQENFIYLYAIPLSIVVIYTTIHHYLWNFDDKAGQWVMQPFYKDHAIYGTAIALVCPLLFMEILNRKRSLIIRILAGIMFTILLLGLYLSFSRGAWLGFIVALVAGLIVYFRIPFKYLFISFLVVVIGGFIFQQKIFELLYKNKQDSSPNFLENVQSITNIRTDASNLERINRWNCAIRMALDYPITGTGPGTYQFLYAPYQMSYERTIISTNAGTLGNAHSEYLGSMAEQGFPGMMIFLAIIIYVFYMGFELFNKLRRIDPQKSYLVFGILLGLLTYFTHAFLNNFLDTDKISFVLYTFIALLLAVKHNLVNKAHKEIQIK